jgi:hypothetical protein
MLRQGTVPSQPTPTPRDPTTPPSHHPTGPLAHHPTHGAAPVPMRTILSCCRSGFAKSGFVSVLSRQRSKLQSCRSVQGFTSRTIVLNGAARAAGDYTQHDTVIWRLLALKPCPVAVLAAWSAGDRDLE